MPVEQLEQEEAAAGSMIAVKKKKGKGKSTGRQTKLTSTAGVSTNSFKVTQRLKGKGTKQQSVLKFQKKMSVDSGPFVI